jgi:fatty-acid desaturase
VVFWFFAFFIWYQLIAHLGISLGLHRYFSHKQFKVPRLLEYVILFLAMIAGARSPIGWISAHRMHHAYSDSEKDPHSPKFKGFWTVLFSQWQVKSIPPKFSRDLFQSPSLLFFHKNWKWLWPTVALISLLISWKIFVFFVLLPAFMSWISFGGTSQSRTGFSY